LLDLNGLEEVKIRSKQVLLVFTFITTSG
jgi:hypothetical protein